MEIDPGLMELARYFVIGLGILVLLAIAVWVMKNFWLLRGTSLFAARDKRIGIVETAVVDSRRRLVLVHRDNVEHLVMIGGPIDVVIEAGISARAPYSPSFDRREPVEPGDDERILIAQEETPGTQTS